MPEELTFTSGGERCASTLYRPETTPAAPVPCVVMAHGFSLTRRDKLPIFAERFAAAGVATLAFDFRFLGDSTGEPRQRIRLSEQREDFRNAFAFARGLDGVDPARLILWGYSMAGGHVARLLGAGRLESAAAAILVAPFVDGLARTRALPARDLAMLTPPMLLDFVGVRRTIPVTAQPGELAAMNFPGEEEGFAATVEAGSAWRNEVSAGVFATVAYHRPWKRAGRIACPLWVGRGEADITADGEAIAKLAERAPRGELHDYPGDHFEVIAAERAEQLAEDQIEFLRRHDLTA